MSKGRRILLSLTALLGGLTLGGCLGGLGLGDFQEGLFAKGFVDNWMLDVLTDWLNEDLFS